MALEFGKESCALRGRLYAHDSVVCNEEKCLDCNNGLWEEREDWPVAPHIVRAVPGKDFSQA